MRTWIVSGSGVRDIVKHPAQICAAATAAIVLINLFIGGDYIIFGGIRHGAASYERAGDACDHTNEERADGSFAVHHLSFVLDESYRHYITSFAKNMPSCVPLAA